VGFESVAVIGGGAWGSALAVHLAARGPRVRLWVREPDLVERIASRRDNPLYLPGVEFPPPIEPSGDVAASVAGAELVLAVVPSQFARGVYRELAPSLPAEVPVVVASKGIEERSLALPLEVAAQELGAARPLAVLSGPSFAAEVARGHPTALAVASEREDLAVDVQAALSSAALRLYTNPDPVGVQVAAALKNVIAIATGVADSLEMGANVRAALITRGLAEISRLGVRLGGRPATFAGLAGLGDLVLTCTGELSRNRQVGRRLGRGERLADILQRSPSVAEGVRTAQSARELARRHDVQMPIVEEVHRILYRDGSPADSLERLMGRPLTAED
jgi:glycerol-3-phosphate dehydrogenase (NAD(P)+)